MFKKNNEKNSLNSNIFTWGFRRIGWTIDLMFKSNVMIIILAALGALSLYFYVNGQPDNLIFNSSETRIINDVKVNVNYDELTTVVKLTDKEGNKIDYNNFLVDVVVTGPRNDVLKLVNNESYEFFIDVNALVDGEVNEASINYSKIPSSITVQISPANILVEKNKKIVKEFAAKAEASNINKVAKNITLESISLSTSEVQVSGSKSDIDSIASVKALVDVSSINSPGSFTIESKNINLVAYDQVGEKVDVGIVAKDLVATAVFSDFFKEVEVSFKFEGSLPAGKSIGDMTSDVSTVKVYGDKSKLDEITSVTAIVKTDDIVSSAKVVARIVTPEGITSVSTTEITLNIALEETVSKKVSKVQLTNKNLATGFVAQALNDENGFVDVEVTGAKSVIEKLNKDNIELAVDLENLTAGEHPVNVFVNNVDNRVKYSLGKQKVTIVISNTN